MDNMDIVNNVEDRTEMIRLVNEKLNEIRKWIGWFIQPLVLTLGEYYG